MPHISATANIKPAELLNTHLRTIAEQVGALACWQSDIVDCGEMIGCIEAVALIQPGTANVAIWSAFQEEAADAIFYEEISVFQQINTDVKESLATRVRTEV